MVDENGKLVSDKKEATNIFNNFFVTYSPESSDKY